MHRIYYAGNWSGADKSEGSNFFLEIEADSSVKKVTLKNAEYGPVALHGRTFGIDGQYRLLDDGVLEELVGIVWLPVEPISLLDKRLTKDLVVEERTSAEGGRRVKEPLEALRNSKVYELRPVYSS